MSYAVVLLVLLFAAPSAFAASAEESIGYVRRSAAWPDAGREAFESGVAAWDRGRYLDARNAWVKAHAWLEKSPRPDAGAEEALSRLLAEADRRSRPTPPAPSPSPSPQPSPARKKTRARTAPNVPNGGAILEKARAARRKGETEKALKLYRIAEQLPGGEAAGPEADALEREMR